MQPSSRIQQLDLINILHYHDHFEENSWRDEISVSYQLMEWIKSHVLRKDQGKLEALQERLSGQVP